ncbi:related to ATP/GTP-binding protein [Phialocephala subalpina]|uniref:Related to ATP/GTP-binding protein n=1 Tax=Phialocephala subalpina TaxID=576137 RepID=A0A1L7XHS5_9HELO|nr:related to ATP/GTP-binding protein [Phialocephala subalpina]
MPDTRYPILEPLRLKLESSNNDGQRIALLTCGITGSGKSTLARSIFHNYPNFIRLSIDKHVFEHHGVYDINYPASRYPELQLEAETALIQTLKQTLEEGERDVVLDLSFWSKEMREEYREIIEKEGGGRYEIVLLVFKGSEEVLWRRVEGRRVQDEKLRENGEGGEGMSVDRETLRGYLEGFEWPGEDEEHFLVRVL